MCQVKGVKKMVWRQGEKGRYWIHYKGVYILLPEEVQDWIHVVIDIVIEVVPRNGFLLLFQLSS